MKTLIVSVITALSVAAVAGPAEDAAKAYNNRGYDAAGIASAKKAESLYGQLVSSTADTDKKNEFKVLQSEAMYFVAGTETDKATLLKTYLDASNLAGTVVAAYGVAAAEKMKDADIKALEGRINPNQKAIFAEALYYQGINLGQWGSAKGGTSSLSGWKKKLRPFMEVLDKMGMASIHNYGPYRTLGRGYYKVPRLLGGSIPKSEKYLSQAVSKTLASGKTYSVNGYNNLYYGETLWFAGKKDQARKLVKAFTSANPNTMDAESTQENVRAQELGRDLLSKWN